MGSYDLSDAAKIGEVVALCDVDATHLAKLREKYPKAATFHDFRQLVLRPDVHVVVNGTPDHWHTLINLAALRAGKDVYSEKPLTLTIDEGKRLVKEVTQRKRVLQTGSQQRSDLRFQLATYLVRSGRIGRLQHIITSLPAGRYGGPFAASPIPAGFDWDFWQGQAPAHEFVVERSHGSFRYWWDYSEGTLTDWGAHHNDVALWGMDLDHSGPFEIEAHTLREPVPGGFSFPSTYRVEYRYAIGVTHTCKTVESEDPAGTTIGQPPPGQMPNGVRFEGTDGWIFISRNKIEASKPEILQDPARDSNFGPAHGNHVANFFDCVRTRRRPNADVVIGHRAVSVCHLGAIALRLGRKIRWNPDRERFVDDPEADRYLARAQRAPYNYNFIG
jgi:predicted dehydrogenase